MRIFTIALFTLLLALQSTAQQSSGSDGDSSVVQQPTASLGADSLLREIEALRREHEMLKMQVENSRDTTVSSGIFAAIKDSVAARIDTVRLATREGVRDFLYSFTEKKRGSRDRGYGGALGPVVGVHVVNVEAA